jgi:hypothetical protein
MRNNQLQTNKQTNSNNNTTTNKVVRKRTLCNSIQTKTLSSATQGAASSRQRSASARDSFGAPATSEE